MLPARALEEAVAPQRQSRLEAAVRAGVAARRDWRSALEVAAPAKGLACGVEARVGVASDRDQLRPEPLRDCA